MAGDTVKFDIAESSDYPISDGYDLTYAFVGPGTLSLGSDEISENGTTYEVRIPLAKTALLNAGVYTWTAFLTSATERYVYRTGTTRVEPDTATAEADTSLEDQLVRLNDAIAALQTSGTSSYSLNGRSVTKIDLPALRRDQASVAAAILSRDNGGTAFMRTHGAAFVAR
jgi:hypothetical protein